ncbi:MAG: SseB family protein [Duncaniella sp.]|nr:SseB family protein [Duncaniella sp.]
MTDRAEGRGMIPRFTSAEAVTESHAEARKNNIVLSFMVYLGISESLQLQRCYFLRETSSSQLEKIKSLSKLISLEGYAQLDIFL